MAPPPPPPLCFPFGSRRRASSPYGYSEKFRPYSETRSQSYQSQRSRSSERSRGGSYDLRRSNSYSPSGTMASKDEKLTFDTDTESYGVARRAPVKKRGWGMGWLLRKQREKDTAKSRDLGSEAYSIQQTAPSTGAPLYDTDSSVTMSSHPPQAHNKSARSINSEESENDLKRNQSTRTAGTNESNGTQRTAGSRGSRGTERTAGTQRTIGTQRTAETLQREVSSRTVESPARKPSTRTNTTVQSRPPLTPFQSSGLASRRRPVHSDSQSTLVGSVSSALDRKVNDIDVPRVQIATGERLESLRTAMLKDNLDFYVIPSEDAHGSETVALGDRRREWISGFTGSSGQAIVTRSAAYLVTDSRYWLQAEDELDDNWSLIRAPIIEGPKDWQAFILPLVEEGNRIGIDARMISYAQAAKFRIQVEKKNAKLIYPTQNLVDLVWKSKPPKSREPVVLQDIRFAGQSARAKLQAIREWISAQPPAKLTYSRTPPTDAEKHIATLVTSLPNIAWVLNLRGRDIPYDPVFHAYLFIALDHAVLFVDKQKVTDEVQEYLSSLDVETRDYNDVWQYLRGKTWGTGKVLIPEETSYAIALILTHFRYTIAPSIIDERKAVKNAVEAEGMRAAYLRDGASYVRWLAWLEDKLQKGYQITEYEAAFRLTEYRLKNEHYMGLAYESISASGPNASLPHYTPRKSDERFIDRETPYLNDSGGQYLDGTIDTTRTMHFGRPSPEQCEAYTRVLQGHIAIDSAIFPEGTSGLHLDVLARKALWKDGLNYLHGTGHGFGSYLHVHEGPHGFSSTVPLQPGHVITNEPGFYNDGHWGMRIESALLVRRVKTKHEFQGAIWLGFERLTTVPIQTRMVNESMLTKEEISWIKAHNKRCRDKLLPLIQDDKRAVKWLNREADRGIGLAPAGPGGISIDWD